MRNEHVAIDGSLVSIEADADLSRSVVTTGWAMVPSLMQTHPFATYPAGHCDALEAAVRDRGHFTIQYRGEYKLADGTLRVAEVEIPTATEQRRQFTVGGWESGCGCLTTSLVGHRREALIEVFDTLEFSASDRGVWIRSPVFAQPRVPEIVKEVPELGIVSIRPALASELEYVPRARGHECRHGELFRVRDVRDALLFVNDSALTRIEPLPGADRSRMLPVAEGLRIEWSPRGADW